MKLALAKPRRRSLMSLTPLIDVVFILLLFFMLASDFSQERSISWQSVDKGETQPSLQPIKSSRVFIQSTERILLDEIPVTQTELLKVMAERFRANPEHSVVIGVSTEIEVQTLLSLLAKIKKTGVENVVMSASSSS